MFYFLYFKHFSLCFAQVWYTFIHVTVVLVIFLFFDLSISFWMSSWDAFPNRSILAPVLLLWFLISCDSFDSNVLMSIQKVPVSESAGKIPIFTFYLIKSAVVTHKDSWFQLIFRRASWSATLNFFLIFALQCNVVILRSLHRYSEYWRPRSQSDCRYFGSYVIISIYTVWTISNILSQTKVPRLSPSMIWHLNVSTFLLHQSTLSCLFRRLSKVFDKTRFNKLNLCRIIFLYMSYLVKLTSFQRVNRSTFDQFCK